MGVRAIDAFATTAQGATAELGAPRPPQSRGLVQIFPRKLEEGAPAWEITRSAVVGRSEQASARLADPRVSRRHCRIVAAAGGLEIEDLSSRHGTFVDGQRLSCGRAALAPGSVIRCGDTLLLSVEQPAMYTVSPHWVTGEAFGPRRSVLAGPVLFQAWQKAVTAGPLRCPVLLLGETGSGKEAVARLIHAGRGNVGRFLALNLAAIPTGLFESELFGHVRGAFSGAAVARTGAFREAAGGVLLLDEIGELPAELQAKLLRTLDDLRVRPLGANDEVAVDVKVVAATNRDLRAAAESGAFRLDLYHRLSGIVIELPPLRARRDEILLLVMALLAADAPELSLSTDAAEALSLADWPGNARELEHTVMQAVLSARQAGTDRLLGEHFSMLARSSTREDDTLGEAAIASAMASARGNASAAAKLLGVSRATLYKHSHRQKIDLAALRTRSLTREEV